MSLHLRPVGPLPAAVYWRRRAVLAAGLLLLLVLLSRCTGSGGPEQLAQAGPSPAVTGSAPTTAATETPQLPSPSVSPAPGATPAPTPTAAPPCPDAALSVQAVPERRRYARSARPVLRLAVRNAGQVACTRPLGRGSVELTVFSGPDRIWSSDDCAPGGPAGPQTLRPQQLEVITLTWAARRSRPGCRGAAEAIEPGTYRVIGRVGGLRTSGSSFVVV
jgi:hypothetical protein